MARNGIPDARDYLLGRGALYFSDDLDTDGRPKNFRHLGNAEAFTVNVETENLEHFSTLEGLKKRDRNVILSQALGVSMELAEIDVENLRLFLAGENTQTAVTGASVDATPGGNPNLIVSGLGRWYDLYDNASPSTYPPVAADSAERVYRLTSVVVKDATDTTTYVEGTDYDLDAELGRIFIREGGSIGATDSLLVDFDFATLTIDEVRGLKQASLTGVLKFVSINANDASKEIEYQFHSVSLRAEGDFALIGDEFATLSLTGEAGENATAYPDSPTVTIRRLSA